MEENSENLLKPCKTNVEEEELTGQIAEIFTEGTANQHEKEENSRELLWKKEEIEDQWENIQEVVESDFLTSPADIYPNRRVELEDAEISEETKGHFAQLCSQYKDVFSKNNQDIGKTTLIEMEIDTGDSLPVAQSPYTLPLKHYEWVRKEIETLEKAGVIVKSLSPWASPVIVVPKKSAPDEPLRRRLVIDYRKINSLQQQIKRADKSTGCLSLYLLPKIDKMFAKLNGSRIFSTTDLRSGYYHIGLTEGSRPKSAFVVPMGKFEFLRTPFGLSQVPAYFQLLINNVLQGCSKFPMGYLDNIIIFSKTEEEHLEHLEKIFKKLREYGLKMKREKCNFFKKHLQYLGHLVLEEGFKPLPEKIKSIKHMPPPKTAKEVKQFLGLAGYYRKFVPRFADLSRPLTNLTRQSVEFEWTEKCQKSCDNLRELLTKYPILRYPDPNKDYTLFTDASKFGYAGVLTQEYEDNRVTKYHPVCYVSGLFRGCQLNWAALTKEAYAIYMAVRKLTFYITGHNIKVKSNHLPLKKFLENKTLNAKVNNWAVELEQFKIELDWISGVKNTLADSLSRLLDMTPEAEPTHEPPGEELGVACFEELESAKVHEVFIEQIENVDIEVPKEIMQEVRIPIPKKQMLQLQKNDEYCRRIVRRMQTERELKKIFILDDGILYRLWLEDGQTYKCMVVPLIL